MGSREKQVIFRNQKRKIMTTLISKEKNLYMVFNSHYDALDFAFDNLTENLCEEIETKKYDWFYKEKSNGDRRIVNVMVYEHKTKV